MTYTPDDPELRGRFKVHSGGKPADMLELVRASDWEGKPVPQRRWLVEDMLPMATVSALYGDGQLQDGAPVTIDVHRPLQSFDAGGSARAVAGLVQALATAKEAGLSEAAVAAAFGALDWSEARG